MKNNGTLGLTAAAILVAGGAASVQAQTTETNSAIKWVSEADAGLTITRGNSSTLLANAKLNTGTKWDQNELNFGASGAYGKSKDPATGQEQKTTELGDIFGQYNRLFNERLYGYAHVEGLHDGIADIRYRVMLSPGLGYKIIKEKTTQLNAEVGPGYIWDDLAGVSRHFWTLRVSENFHQDLSSQAYIWEKAEWLPQVTKFNNYIINAELGISADILPDKRISLKSYIDDTYNNQPAAGRLKNDLAWYNAISYKF